MGVGVGVDIETTEGVGVEADNLGFNVGLGVETESVGAGVGETITVGDSCDLGIGMGTIFGVNDKTETIDTINTFRCKAKLLIKLPIFILYLQTKIRALGHCLLNTVYICCSA